jgi:hypothetical protein
MQSKQQTSEDDGDLGLIDIIQFLIQQRIWITSCTGLALLIAGSYLMFKPNVFEASATIQMAMVSDEAIEKASELNEKIKLPLYFSASTLQNCTNDGKPSLNGSLADLLKTKAIANTPFLNISLRMSSAEQATSCMTSILADIQSHQAVLAAPVIEKKKTLQESLRAQLTLADELARYFSSQLTPANVNNGNFSAAFMLLATSTSKENEAKLIQKQLLELEAEMSAAQTKPASFAAPIYAPAKPVDAQPWLILLLATMLGCLVGALTAWMKAAWLSVSSGLKTHP